MSKVLLLGLVIVFSAVFLVIPANNDAPVYAMFPFADEATISIRNYVYFIFEHVQIIVLCFIVAVEARSYLNSCYTFFYLQVADFADYLLTYNAIWFHAGTLPVSMNLVKVAIFAAVFLYEHNKQNE